MFGFGNSLFANPRPGQPSGDLTSNWSEGFVKPSLSGVFTARKSWQIHGTLSVVGEGTWGAAPPLEATSFDLEEANVGWRSGDLWGRLGENALDVTVGRSVYELGHGLLIFDGAAEGGSRGGYWSNARHAFDFAAIGRFRPGHHTVETFYLEPDELPEAETGTHLAGINYEYALGEHTTLGATAMKIRADPAQAPQRDGLRVLNARVYTASFPRLEPLSFEAEYAREENGDALDARAWNALAAWQFAGPWAPKLSYRYAFFEGDDPATARNEGFDPLLQGFNDWGVWWQGEIAGEYFVGNSNLISHLVRIHVTPRENIGTGLMLYRFLAQRPAALGPGVTSRDVAFEADWYMDWDLNDNFTASFIAAWADPGTAVEQKFGRTETFRYAMAYLSYTY